VAAAAFPALDLKKSRPGVHEMVRVRQRYGLYEVREIDRGNGTVHVMRNLPRNAIHEYVPLEAICRLNTRMAQIIDRFLNS